MTLGGLALAVGILVDDATVTIENINWHLEHGKDVRTAIMDGARQIVQPAFVSLLCICIVFVPMFALSGVAGYLFVPMAMSVVFAMIASFILSRTLVPTMAMYLLKPHINGAHDADAADHAMHQAQGVISSRACSGVLRPASKSARESYRNLLALAMNHRRPVRDRLSGLRRWCRSCWCRSWARISFPRWIPARSRCMCARRSAPASKTPPSRFAASKQKSATSFPHANLTAIVDNIGLPASSINHDLQ